MLCLPLASLMAGINVISIIVFAFFGCLCCHINSSSLLAALLMTHPKARLPKMIKTSQNVSSRAVFGRTPHFFCDFFECDLILFQLQRIEICIAISLG